ncbi:YchF/TatD family DNA exonuclease [Vibrio sp. V27_P1S3P104]|uniref:TatD family hydrolase n=1 Tax=Vibrio TaxID=662 RepID=UPI000C1680AA|nr:MULTISPECIES: YchF/TatD family DNA exonuclease [Vibrio]NAW68213.1 YchF/TatD family DNA exonuclease [Vibrio sp. V28_P6S34P95]NAX05599.1 YchF/TatD family DNA exonuclease [Vibrio sp. V30_P3S12P165]NAX34948.1 YchF/TatD family DNA exonuclease [Vibrio sp. V29_P1S30P107]NAX38860.1 YchF/TatD family DNA exonuclease [Vibrio sp. V27_P1S3P104]NAX39292.1 YchF/TatD family DNA exonuclease [Vibrio sp. V26_P1S5P106]
MFVDSHCHLDKLDYQNIHKSIDDVIAKAEQAKVKQLLSVGVTLDSFSSMLAMIEPYQHVYASCGVHPLDVMSDFELDRFREYASHTKVVAIGETGLDYHYQPETADLQKLRFSQHIDVAVDLNKPLIIHTRQARQDTLAILRQGHAERCGGVIHCFTEDLSFAEAAIELGFYISISGIVTFRQATELKEVVKQLPLERLLIETDSPYLAPVPYRGQENQPAYVAEVAESIARLKGLSVHKVAEKTSKNFQDLFLR